MLRGVLASSSLPRSSFSPVAQSQRRIHVCVRMMASSFEKDKSSLTDASAYRCSSLRLCLDVDFAKKVLGGHVDLNVQAHKEGVEKLVKPTSAKVRCNFFTCIFREAVLWHHADRNNN